MSNLTNGSHERAEFEGLHVVVTGGTGALGTSVVALLLKRGAWCHVPHLGEAGRHFELNHPRLSLVPDVDLRNEASVEQFYSGLPQLWASLHLAGGFKPSPALGGSLPDLQKMFILSAGTCFLCCREAALTMRGQGSAGRIVNVAAQAALEPSAANIAYSVSKAAVVALTKSFAEGGKDYGILVNAVAPSIIDTPMNRSSMPNADYSRWPSTEEVAEAILYLASPRNTLTSGATIPVYGRM